MVFAIFVDTTWPIFVLRSESPDWCWFDSIAEVRAVFVCATGADFVFAPASGFPAAFFVAAMGYFLPVAVCFSAFTVLVFALALAAAGFFATAGFAAFGVATAAACAPLLLPLPRTRSRAIVFMRAMSLRSPRIFFKLSVCPIFIWNFRRKSWSLRSRSWSRISSSERLRTLSAVIPFAIDIYPLLLNPLLVRADANTRNHLGAQ